MSDRKNFLIVGGTSGIGKALATILDKDHHLILASRKAAVDGNHTHLIFDATKGELPLEEFPAQLDGLVYCPGTITLKPFHRITDEEFLQDYQVNVLGAIRTIRKVLPLLKNSAQSSIVLFSTVAVQQGMPFHASIAASKGAIEGLTKSLAAELAPKIRVNAIAPSLTNTPLANKLLSTDEKKKASDERHPLKRTGQPEDIANLAAFLLLNQSSWISGQIFHVDGGLSTLRV
ncbi:MAG: SDR family oxidoreductase [Cyclobacteriaceae bacterium]|nr:SDR family oxidoreductase [Cyclobacteriaceae bacterium]